MTEDFDRRHVHDPAKVLAYLRAQPGGFTTRALAEFIEKQVVEPLQTAVLSLATLQ